MKKYYFDFCGTLIKQQTHEQIKYFCIEKKYFFYFIKILVPKRLKIKFDCHYLSFFNLHDQFSEWLLLNSTPAKSLKILERLIYDGKSVTVLTLADQITVSMYLSKYLDGMRINVVGSSVEKLCTASIKAEIVREQSETIFFTDSMLDLPAMKVATTVVISEFCSSALKKYADEHKYLYALNYE